jgi:hypothetical protein
VVRLARLIQAPRLCARLRLHPERADPEATWESTGPSGPAGTAPAPGSACPAAGCTSPDGEAVGVELERYGKKLGRYQGAAADADLAGSAAWFTPDRPGPAADQRLWEAGGGDVHQVYQLPEAVTPWPPSPSAGASYPHGPSAQPPDQYLHGAGNHRPHQVVLLLAGVVA